MTLPIVCSQNFVWASSKNDPLDECAALLIITHIARDYSLELLELLVLRTIFFFFFALRALSCFNVPSSPERSL